MVACSDHVTIHGDVHVQRPQHGVILQQVREGCGVGQVVGRHYLDPPTRLPCAPHGRSGVDGPPEVAPDPAKPIDPHPDSHRRILLIVSLTCPAARGTLPPGPNPTPKCALPGRAAARGGFWIRPPRITCPTRSKLPVRIAPMCS